MLTDAVSASAAGSIPGITIISSTVKTVDPAAVADAAAEALEKLSANAPSAAGEDESTTGTTTATATDAAPAAATTDLSTAAAVSGLELPRPPSGPPPPPPPSGPPPPPPSASAPATAPATVGLTAISDSKPVALPPPLMVLLLRCRRVFLRHRRRYLLLRLRRRPTCHHRLRCLLRL